MRCVVAALVVIVSIGCVPVDNSPSGGQCSGAHGTEEVGEELDESSEFHRLDFQDGVEKTSIRIADKVGAFAVTVTLNDMPKRDMETDHPLDAGGTGGGAVEDWAGGAVDPAARRGVLTLTSAQRERLGGQVSILFDDDSEATCTFDLRRAYELDTDD